MAEPRNQPAPRQQPAPRNQDDLRGTRAPASTQRTSRSSAPKEDTPAVAAIKAKQRAMSEAGFATAIDGEWGPDSEKRWEEFQRTQREKADRESRQAEALAEQERQKAKAAAVQAEAEAEKARADAEKIKAQAAADKAKAEREAAAEKASRDATESAVKLGLNIAFPVAGAGLGHVIAKGIGAKHAAAMAARSAEIERAAKQVQATMRRAEKLTGSFKSVEMKKLRGQVASADKLSLTKVKGPVGAGTAALLLAEGFFARFVVAEKADNAIAKEALQLVSTASVFAATTVLSERAVANATAKVLPSSTAAATIEAARQLSAPRPQRARGGVAGKVIDAVIGPPKPKPRATPAAKATPAIAHVAPGTTGPTPPPIPPTAAKPPPLPANLPPTLPAAKPPVRVTAGRAFGLVGLVAAAVSVAMTARSQGAAAAVKEAGTLLDPTAGAAGRVIDAIATRVEPQAAGEPSLGALAKQQSAERTVSTSPMENLARQAAEAQMPASQRELTHRVLSAGNGGLEHYYEGAVPPEFAERAKYQGLAGQQAAEANAEKERPGPTIADVAGPPPEVAQGGPRGWANPVVQEAAQKARREKGLI